MKDEFFKKELPDSYRFEFDDEVASVFEDMMQRSVPLYSENLQICQDLALLFYQPKSHILDLGCSTGTLLIALSRLPFPDKPDLIGIDSSPAMEKKFYQNCQQQNPDANFAFLQIPVEKLTLELCQNLKPSVVFFNYTLQFIDPKKRQILLELIYKILLPQGILILCEKTKAEDEWQGLLEDVLYVQFKRHNGYSDVEIQQKRKALQSVLTPHSLPSNRQKLKQAGFQHTVTVLQWCQFSTLLACKDPQTPSVSLEEADELVITPEYEKVLKAIQLGCPVIFVTGKAGTGKSTLIEHLNETLVGQKKNIVNVAPTGVAALNVQGMTIHSFFCIPPDVVDINELEFKGSGQIYRSLDLLIIDEVSMARADLIDLIDGCLKYWRESTQPFGGVQVLLVGDLFQLPPVIRGEDLEDFRKRGYLSEYFFSARVFQDPVVSIELKKVFRQADPEFVAALNQIREGIQLNQALHVINSCLTPTIPQGAIMLTARNAQADEYNQQQLSKIQAEEHEFEGEIIGKFNLTGNRLPSPSTLVLKEEAQVMFTKNDENKRWVNGTLGKVIGVETYEDEESNEEQTCIVVEIYQNDYVATVKVLPTSWATFRYKWDATNRTLEKEKIGEYIQYPLTLAWAVTIHKSQGKTLPSVYIDLGDGAFAPGQVYVALSRAKSLQDLHLARKILPRDVRVDFRIKDYYQKLFGS